MEYKIWTASYFVSPPPYPIEVPKEKIESQACCWKTEETIWRHIGTVDSLEAARYLVENDRGSYKDSEGNTLANINSLHSQLANFLSTFHGVSTKHLQQYLDWFVFIYTMKKKFSLNKIKTESYNAIVLDNNYYIKANNIVKLQIPIDLNIAYAEYQHQS